MTRFVPAALAAALLAALSANASAQEHMRPQDDPPAETRLFGYTGSIPPCDYPEFLSQIAEQFAKREASYPWGSRLSIVGFENVLEIGYRLNGESYIPARYCRASALLSDGGLHAVGYQAVERQGFIGLGYGVLWCVVGFDREHAFSPYCRMTNPPKATGGAPALRGARRSTTE